MPLTNKCVIMAARPSQLYLAVRLHHLRRNQSKQKPCHLAAGFLTGQMAGEKSRLRRFLISRLPTLLAVLYQDADFVAAKQSISLPAYSFLNVRPQFKKAKIRLERGDAQRSI